jgi:hypothetical protein
MKVRVFTSPIWWKTKGLVALREFFAKLLNIKPRDTTDYYSVLRWQISKRLAFAMVIVIGVLSIYYVLVLSPIALTGGAVGNASLPVYKYNSLAVRFFSGSCRIEAKGDYVAYEGSVKKGEVTGSGRLFDRDGRTVYEGDFDKNRYNGVGQLYYPNGELKYTGEFSNNEMNGEGKLFATSGAVSYEGEFLNGKKNGKGVLFNASANEIYRGNFVLDEIAYEEFVGKTAEEAATMYPGIQEVYAAEQEFTISMKEIGAVSKVTNGDDSLEGEGKISGITVLKDYFAKGGKSYKSITEVTTLFGRPDFAGYTYCMLSDAIAINALPDLKGIGPISLSGVSLFDEVYSVEDYDKNVEVYIYAYKAENILYTFYCGDPQDQEFFMYSVEVGE